jgi:hypothetical protein
VSLQLDRFLTGERKEMKKIILCIAGFLCIFLSAQGQGQTVTDEEKYLSAMHRYITSAAEWIFWTALLIANE